MTRCALIFRLQSVKIGAVPALRLLLHVRDVGATSLVRLGDEAGSIVEVRVLAELRDGLRLALSLAHDDARKVLVRALLVLRIVNSCSIVAAGLVPRRLLKLTLEQLVPLLNLIRNAAIRLVLVEDFGPVLRRDDLLLLLCEHRSVVRRHRCPLNVLHLHDLRLGHLLGCWLDRRHCQHAMLLHAVETDNIAASIAS